LVLQHLPYVPPTSRNKMFNAEISSQDFGGSWTEKTAAPTGTPDQRENRELARDLLAACQFLDAQECKLTNDSGTVREFVAYGGLVTSRAILRFLRGYRWEESRPGRSPVDLELKYIERENEAGRLQNWLVLVPQTRGDQQIDLPGSGFPKLSVV